MVSAAYLMQIAYCSINRGAERLSERGERDGKKAETFPGGETERRRSAAAAAAAPPNQTPGGRTSAQRGAAQPRPEAPPGERERANPSSARAGQGGTGGPPAASAPPKPEGREDAPQRPGDPREQGKGQERRASSADERKGATAPGQTLARGEQRAPERRGGEPGERPGTRERARPPTRAAARGGHGEPEKGRRRNEPHPGESAYIFCSEPARNDRPRAGGLPPERAARYADGTTVRSSAPFRASAQREREKGGVAASPRAVGMENQYLI